MFIKVETKINASKEQAWKAISDIENAADVFKDIKKLEVIDKPEEGLLGFKWKEVREFMGKEAEETMWIVEVIDQQSYLSEAHNAGCIYNSGMGVEESGDGVVVYKSFRSTPQSVFAKLMTPMMHLMKGSLKKCIQKDLDDLKAYLEI